MGIGEWDNYTVMDINNIRHNYGPVNDYTHNSMISYVWELPFGPGKRYLGGTRGVAGHLAGEWHHQFPFRKCPGAPLGCE
jgi:hypothetical protein